MQVPDGIKDEESVSYGARPAQVRFWGTRIENEVKVRDQAGIQGNTKTTRNLEALLDD